MNKKAIIGFLVTGLLFYFLFRDIDFALFLKHLKEGNPLLIIAGGLIYLSGFIFRGIRWRILLSHIKEIPLAESVKLTGVGYAVNNVLPSRIGEFTRAYLMGNRNRLSRTSSLASIFVERVFDGLSIVAILMGLLFLYPFPGWVRSLSQAAGALFGILFLAIIFSSISYLPLKLLRKIEPMFPKFTAPLFRIGEKFLHGAASISSISELIKILFLSFFIWGIEVCVYIAMTHAFNVEAPLLACFLMLVTVNLGMLVPSTPGGLGVFQFMVVKSLGIFNIASGLAMAVAIVLHMIQIVPITIIGLFWLAKNHISIKRIEEEKMKYKYLFGPVPSRRLGISLGVDLIPYKTCDLDCLYCESGATTDHTVKRAEYYPLSEIKEELRHYLSGSPKLDYITFSGAGEPTLYSRMGELITFIKQEFPAYQIALITNTTLFHDPEVRKEVEEVDLIVPSFDAADQKTFEKINRPVKELKIEEILGGFLTFTETFKGKIWAEIFIVQGVNDKLEVLENLKEWMDKFNPEKIQINSLDRPGTVEGLEKADMDTLLRVKTVMGEKAEIVVRRETRLEMDAFDGNVEDTITKTLRIRPMTIKDLSSATGLHELEIGKYLGILEEEEKITVKITGGHLFYTLKYK